MKASEKIKKLRKEYIVVARTFADDDEPSYSITKRDNFSVMPYHDTFGHYGEVDYTCDYTIEENDSCFDEFKSSVKNELRLDVERTCDGLSFTDPDTGEEVAITPPFELYIKMWRARNQFVPEVSAWNYHDRHNWQSIILDGRELDIEPCYEEVDEETANRILSQFDGSANDKGGRYETEDYIFTSSKDQSDPWTVHVEEKQQ